MEEEKEPETLLDINVLFPRFKEHLEMVGNIRILFSGQFGIGKTYFLNKFFKHHEEEYFCIHLHPTNYQIATNEKIMEFIKTDILLSILDKSGYKTENKTRKVFSNIHENGVYKIVMSLGKVIPIPKMKELLEAIETLIEVSGTVTEGDIKNSLEKIKEKKVLIIDDLDRMDPQHIFRILNVFSTFVGEGEGSKEETESDRMGFDKVIFVCDLDNVRNIFSHIYGEKADFAGYVNKYYSTKAYRYDDQETRENILNHLDIIVSSFNVNERTKEHFTEPNMRGAYVSYLIHKTLIEGFRLKNGGPNLRILFKAVHYKLPSLTNMRSDYQVSQLKMVNQGIISLIDIFGDKETLINCIKNIITENNHKPADSEREGQANSAFGGLMLKALEKQGIPDVKSEERPGDKTVYLFGQSNNGEKLNFILEPAQGGKHTYLLLEGGLHISTRVLYDLLLRYLENDLEES
ncbi:MAG: P-loop NTPase fold protein [Candidatus Kaiserbacteria bacterium]|nr:P-loop NTPase fold protein [Candidatus Kaiserbacteria bacterium]